MFRTLHLHARIRAICMIFALLLVPGIMQAEDVYLLTAETINGTTGNYNVLSNHNFTNSSGTVYTYTITSMPATGFWFRIGVKGWDDNMQPYKNDDPLTIDGASYTITKDCYGKTKAWKVSYTEGEYKSLTITVDLSEGNRYVKITGVKSSTGGGTSTTCTPGLYIAGDKYGKTGDQYIYKLQRNKDKQYYISLNAINGAEWSNVQRYSTGQGMDNYYVKTIGQTYHLVYIDDQGKETDYYPSTNGYTLTGSDPNTGSDKTKDFSTTTNTNWTIDVLNSNDANGGIYNFYVNTDVNGVPQNWYYEADQTKVVAYEVNESTHTTDAYLYCTRANTTGEYNKNFFGMVSFVKDGYHSFLFADMTYGRRQNSNSPYDQDAAADSPNAFQFSKDHLDTGIYTTEFNPTRDYIISGDKKPTRIFIIGSALNSNLSDTFTDWDPSNATEMVYDVDEGCYKVTVTLNKDKQFRFLLDHNESGAATSLDNNFGEDENKPGSNGDTDYNNKVKVESSSTSGSNITFNPGTDTYVVRFYVERKADKQGFQWTNDYGIYRYTIEKPERLNATITPTAATVNYAASLTPKVSVVGTDAKTRTYAFTIDGSNPTIDATTGKGTGSTVVRTYTYDPVVPTNDVYTFYMSSADQLTYIDFDGNDHTLDGNTVTVKAQAVQTVTSGTTTYRLEGDIATGNYTFETAGVQPGSNYTISIKNENEGTTPSVNKAIADVTVTNSTKNADDGVDVYYTTDGSDPASSTTARLVRGRKVTVYALPGEVGNKGTLRVAIPNTKASASCDYDITYSTSEGGYQNYLNNSNSQKTLGDEGHVVVYVQPYSSDNSYSTDARQAYVYAYEKLDDGTFASLTHAHRLLTNADKTSVNDETWYALDLEPASNYKEVNVLLGYYDDTTYKTTDATVANACQDMFLRFDVATGQITDVTHAYTRDHFYTIGTNGTKSEAANPASNSPFFYAQVPLTWTSNGNKVKVFNGESELSGATVTVQNGAEISELSSVCKISVPTSLVDKTVLTLKPYKGETASDVSFTINYQNGGYYFYESANHYSGTAPLVFSADAENDKDLRSYGRHDINHVTTGDKTHYLSSDWTYSTETESKTTPIDDNWTGSTATVNVIPSGTTISQTVTGLTAGTPYTVQMIVRGKSGATGTLALKDATEVKATVSKSFAGYNAQGTITTDGRVEALLSGTNNGWQKLEAVANATADGKLTISLAANGAELQLSDVTLLEKANTKGYVWTKATTSNDKTEFDLTDRTIANAFSFFDRGDNKNAIVYANANTVLGMSEKTYDVAVSNGSNYTMHKLALTDAGTSTADQRTSSYTFGVSKTVTTKSFAYDRSYKAGIMSSFCLPVAFTKSQLKEMGVATVYEYKSLKVETGKDTEVQFTEHDMSGADDFTTTAGVPYIVKFTSDGTFSATYSDGMSVSGTAGKSSDGVFNGNYGYTKLRNADANNPTLFFYSASGSNYGKFVPAFSDKEGTHMKSFRGYFDFSKYTSSAKRYVFSLIGNGSTTTDIKTVEDVAKSNHGPIYSVNGQLVSKDGDYSRLPKGIYIQNNHKFVIK